MIYGPSFAIVPGIDKDKWGTCMNVAHMMKKLHRTMTPEARARAWQRIIEPSQPSGAFYLLMCLSAVIATFGLLANSTAVVIGAMLVAPLMGPIFGIALALSTGDRQLLQKALFAEIIGIILAVGLSALIGLIPLRPDFGSEILARTQPTIYDVLIALASGLAGAYALVDEKISPALPGVAIATALVPPLAACGLNIAAGHWWLAWGAFLLFLVNLIAIEFAASSIFMLMGLVEFPQAENGSHFKVVIQRLGISFVILLLATTFMTRTLITIVGERKLDKEIRDVLAEQLTTYAGARLSDVNFDKTDAGLQVMAVVVTPQEFEPSRVISLEEGLREAVHPNTQLIVRSVLSKDADRNGPVFISPEEIKRRNLDNQEMDFMNRVSRVLAEQINTVNGARLTDVAKDTSNGSLLITANVRTPQAITPDKVASIQQHLNSEVDSTIKLVVRSILTKDADAEQFLSNISHLNATLQGEDLDLYAGLLNEISWYLAQQIDGVAVAELNFQQDADEVNVYVSVNTPHTVEPALVARLQTHLQNTIDPRTRITVRSIVGATASADAYTAALE